MRLALLKRQTGRPRAGELHGGSSRRNSPMPDSRASVGWVKIRGALETPDGKWRVEVVQHRGQVFYRLLHGENVVDGLAIATVQRLLEEAGVDMAELIEVAPEGTVGAA